MDFFHSFRGIKGDFVGDCNCGTWENLPWPLFSKEGEILTFLFEGEATLARRIVKGRGLLPHRN
jgi:hypothetical protein